MELAYEVIAAIIVLVAFAGERAAELFGSVLFATLEKRYGIKIDSKDVRTAIMVGLVTVFNMAVLYGADLDVLAKLLEKNQSPVTIAMAAFAASGLSAMSHGLIKFFGGKSVINVLRTGLDAAEELSSDEQPKE